MEIETPSDQLAEIIETIIDSSELVSWAREDRAKVIALNLMHFLTQVIRAEIGRGLISDLEPLAPRT